MQVAKDQSMKTLCLVHEVFYCEKAGNNSSCLRAAGVGLLRVGWLVSSRTWPSMLRLSLFLEDEDTGPVFPWFHGSMVPWFHYPAIDRDLDGLGRSIMPLTFHGLGGHAGVSVKIN